MSLKSPLTSQQKKDNARWARIKRVYGITKEQYDELYTSSCPICLRSFSGSIIPVIDHDHASGHVRGILCKYCNHRIVGRHRDSSVLRRVADYIDSPSRGWIVPKKKKKVKKKNGTT